MTSIQGRRRLCRERISKGLSESSSLLESSNNEAPVNPFAESPVAKYTEENLQSILKTVFEAWAPPSDGPCKKSLKARSPEVYCDKSHMEYYNFY